MDARLLCPVPPGPGDACLAGHGRSRASATPQHGGMTTATWPADQVRRSVTLPRLGPRRAGPPAGRPRPRCGRRRPSRRPRSRPGVTRRWTSASTPSVSSASAATRMPPAMICAVVLLAEAEVDDHAEAAAADERGQAAVATTCTAAVRKPAMISGTASGSSTRAAPTGPTCPSRGRPRPRPGRPRGSRRRCWSAAAGRRRRRAPRSSPRLPKPIAVAAKRVSSASVGTARETLVTRDDEPAAAAGVPEDDAERAARPARPASTAMPRWPGARRSGRDAVRALPVERVVEPDDGVVRGGSRPRLRDHGVSSRSTPASSRSSGERRARRSTSAVTISAR